MVNNNIIFLDLDGVLLTDMHERGRRAHPPALSSLNKVIEEFDCKVVIISDIRKLHDGVAELRRLCIDPVEHEHDLRGLDPKRIVGATPVLNNTRGSEISEWLDTFGQRYEPMKYVVIDDNADLAPHLHSHVHIDTYDGFTEIDAECVRALLRD